MLKRAIAEALAQGDSVRGTTSPNPPVGAVLIDDSGAIVGRGATQPPGGPHAEVMALRDAGERATGATAVVTLEPCNHTGRTGPCSHALVDAGVKAVYYLQPDPNPLATGGAEYLRGKGIKAICLNQKVPALEAWLHGIRTGRPRITAKVAQTLDGFVAAADGTSQWITGEGARRHAHDDRATRDAIVVGTGTALADNPSLTARDADGNLLSRQPVRRVIGTRDLAGQTPNLERLGFEQYQTIDDALTGLFDDGARDVLIEGGPGLIHSLLERNLIDVLRVYIAPMVLGAGRDSFGGQLADTLMDAKRFEVADTRRLGDDIMLDLTRKET